MSREEDDIEGDGKGKIMRSIGWFFGAVILVGALVLIGIFVYNLINSGQGEYIIKEGWTNVQPGVEEGKKGVFGFWEYITHPGAANRDFDSVVIENVDNVNLGVKIDEFNGVSPEFDENKPIQMFARIEMAGISGNNVQEPVLLGCSLEDYKGDFSVEPILLTYYGDGNLYVDSALCNFPRGINIYGSQDIDTKKAVINATSEYTQLVTYRAYFMRNEDYNQLRINNENPFQKYAINYQYLNPLTNEVTSVSTKGPLNIGIGVTKTQPLTEGTEYIPLIVSFKNNLYSGNLVDITDFKLILSNLIELDTNPNACAFVLIEERGDNNVYGLSQYVKEKGFTNLDEYGGDSLSCNFKVVSDFPSDFSDIFYTIFRLEAKYVYSVEKKTNIKIRNSEDDEEDACNYILNEFECINSNSCKPQFIDDEFSNCVKCIYASCSEYKDEESCYNNYCQFSNGCYWSEASCKPNL